MDSSPRVVIVTEDELQQMFNAGRYWERMLAGAFVEVALPANVVPRRKGMRAGTMGRRVEYREPHSGALIAVVHEFLTARGDPIPGKRPDPKRLRVGNVIFTVDNLRTRQS